MANTNFINECKNRANANRLGGIVLEGREKLISDQTLLIRNSVPNSKIDLELYGKSVQAISTNPVSPSPDYPSKITNIASNVKIETSGKNRWNNDLITNIVTKNTDGFTITNIWANGVLENQNVLKTFKPNTKYTIKIRRKILDKPTTIGSNTTYDLVLYKVGAWYPLDEYSKYETNVGDVITTYRTITTPADLSDYRVLCYSFFGNNNGSTNYRGLGSVEIQEIMVVEGSYTAETFPQYEAYQGTSVDINLNGNVLTEYDKLIIKDGRAIIQKKSRNLSLAIADMANSEDYPGWRNVVNLGEDYPNKNTHMREFCNYKCNIAEFSTGGVGINSNGGGSTLFLSKGVFGLTQTQWKEQYPDLVFNLIYELAEPYEIDLGKITTLKTFNGTTYITNSEDAKMSVEASVWQNELSNSDYLQSFEMDSGCYVDGNIIGSVYSKCLKANFINDQNNLTDKTIQARIGVKYANLSNEYINMGKYTVERPNNEITANMSQITAYDDLYTNLDKKYVCNIDYSDGNKTLSDLYADVCEQLGLTPATTTFTNSTIPITDNPFTNGEKNRTVLQTVAKVSCSFIDIDNDTNKIDLYWLSTSDEPDYIFYKNDYSSVEGGQVVCGPINCLIIKNSQIDDENVSIKDDESISANGEHSITISEDYILYNTELRQQAINAIWNKIKGMKYVDCKLITYYGKPFLKLGDYIRIYTSETEYFDTYVLKHNFTFDGTFTSVIESPAPTEQEIKTKQDISLGEALRNTQIEVNKQKGEIRSITTKQENIQSDITNNYYNKTNINELLQTAESGITNTFSEAGGNNIFRNTGLWFENDGEDKETNPYEFWSGKALRKSNDEASNSNSILLLNSTLSQEQEVPNGNYSISFWYKKLISQAIASVVINDKEYQLDSTDYKQFYTGEQDSETKEYITEPIVVTTGHLKIEFKCNANGGVEVYDLMANKGTVKLAYSQNANETTTETVNISKGITITSTNMETIFKANANGIKILTLQKETIAYFTDKGLSTNELIVKNKAQMCSTLISEVGDQTWFTRM